MSRRVLALVVAFTLLGTGVAHAQEATFVVTLDNLVPGVPQSDTFTITLDRDAEFDSLIWIDRTGTLGEADTVVSLCDSDGPCNGGATPPGTRITAGDVDVTVTVTLAPDATAAATGRIEGRLVFVGVDEVTDLPFTGANVMSLTAWGVALICVGLFIVALARREDEAEDGQ